MLKLVPYLRDLVIRICIFWVFANVCVGPSGTVKLAKKEPVKKESVAKPAAATEKKPAAAKVCYGPICPACGSRSI